MKKSDIAMIIFIASISVLVAYIAATTIFGSLTKDSVKVKTIAPIDSTLVEPRADIFNKNAINPAVQVQITGTSAATTTVGTK